MISKFRAWDKNQQIMRGVRGLFWSKNNLVAHCSPAGNKFDEFFTTILNDGECHLMQSTGLFDNSTPKKEIFESDIVEWEHKDTGQLVRGIVKYDTELGFWGMTDARFNDLRAIGYLSNQKVTVLGNIYQNKELVEELK